jgi:hypothetical protein
MSVNNLIDTGISKIHAADANHAKAYISNANDTLKHAGHYMLEVLNGAHAGSTHIQKSGSVSVGSASENDVILFASNAYPNHFEIKLASGIVSKLSVKPIDASVTLEDGSIVEVGQEAEIGTDEVISFADTEIAISRIADPKSFVKPAIRVIAFVCVLAMIPLVYGIAAGFLGTVAEAGSRVVNSVQHGIEKTSSSILGTVATAPTQDNGEAFAWTVRVKLEDLQLNHKLRVSSTPDGSIRVFGNVSDKELPRWTSFLQWYDTKSNFPQLIRDVSRANVGTNIPQIKSVWLDDNPSVFFKDGTVGSVGSNLKAGWKIVSIDDASVMIERDGAIISLTY